MFIFSEKLYLKNNRVITRQYFIYKYITGRKKIAVVMTDLHLETLFWYLTFFFFIKKGGWFSLVWHSSSLRKNDFLIYKKRIKGEMRIISFFHKDFTFVFEENHRQDKWKLIIVHRKVIVWFELFNLKADKIDNSGQSFEVLSVNVWGREASWCTFRHRDPVCQGNNIIFVIKSVKVF